MENVFEELKRYIGFDANDEQALRALHPVAQPKFEAISEKFYERILAHPAARVVLERGESSVGRLKITLQAWMDLLLRGPWDDFYFETRSRIGRVHVRIALPQHYMFGAMNVIRQQLDLVVDEHYRDQAEKLHAAHLALGKILDLELAIMLHTYREDLLAQQAKVERLSTFGQLVASIGHELRNPLGVMESSLYLLKGRVGPDERVQKHIDGMQEQLQLSNRIITNLLDMIRDRPLNLEQVKLADVIKNAAEAVRRPEGVQLILQGLDDLPSVPGDTVQLHQVFVNLLENAVQAVPNPGVVQVIGSKVNGTTEISVQDSGPGIDPTALARLFEPLNTTKKRGIGLGLALVKRIVERHRGTIRYEPRDPNSGACFVLRFPSA
jgi:signal transduction histidine kinase